MRTQRDWLALTPEKPLDPQRRIIDAHHHLHDTDDRRYLLNDLIADTRAGHNVTDVVFVETSTAYRREGPEELRSVGETEFAAAQAQLSAGRETHIAAIVSFRRPNPWPSPERRA